MYRMNFEGEISEMEALFTSSILSASGDEIRSENAIQAALENGDVTFMQRLIMNGGILFPMDNDTEKFETTMFIMQMLFWEHDAVHSVSEAYYERILSTFEPLSRTRFFLMMRALEVLMNIKAVDDRPKEVQNYVLCLNLAFETIPGPVISSEEVRNYLEKLLCGLVPKEAVKAISEEYERNFEESRTPLTPRSLMHLSRCSIRQILQERRSLPVGIKSLPVPEMIKNYIKIV